MEPYCLERALIAAVGNGNHFSVGKLVMKGATNVENALQLSKEMKKHEVRAMLLLVLAALKNDKGLIVKHFGTSFENPTSVSIIQSSINTVWYVYTCHFKDHCPSDQSQYLSTSYLPSKGIDQIL